MRASLYEGSRTFRTAPATRPARAQDQALLRVLRAGICGTDLHIFQGTSITAFQGGIIGHETFAEVVEAPAGSGFARGSRGRRADPRLRRVPPAGWAATTSATA
jgi:threonine dehydrogenase-like Zn-dependent dehydrogenase